MKNNKTNVIAIVVSVILLIIIVVLSNIGTNKDTIIKKELLRYLLLFKMVLYLLKIN